MLKDYITNQRLAGGIVNNYIIIVSAKEIMKHMDPSCLYEHGGNIVLVYIISQKSCICVKRKGAEAAQQVPPDFDAGKATFLERVGEAATVERLFVLPQVIVNFDQTGAKFIPVSEWTLTLTHKDQIRCQ